LVTRLGTGLDGLSVWQLASFVASGPQLATCASVSPSPAPSSTERRHDLDRDFDARVRVQRRAHPDRARDLRRAGHADPRPPGRLEHRTDVCIARVRVGAGSGGRFQGRERRELGCGHEGSQPRQHQVLRQGRRLLGLHEAAPRRHSSHPSVALHDRGRGAGFVPKEPTRAAAIPTWKNAAATTRAAYITS
jgi:hypothetical protein